MNSELMYTLILGFLVFCLIMWLIYINFIRYIISPTDTIKCRIVEKYICNGTFVVFENNNGVRLSLLVAEREYGTLKIGAKGILQMKADAYWGFMIDSASKE